jgi:hypothetical protein
MLANEPISNCVEYVLEVLLGEDMEELIGQRRVVYEVPGDSVSNQAAVCIIPSGFFERECGSLESMPSLPLSCVDDVPLLYGSPEIQRNGDRLITHADIIASAYFMLTRYEEAVRRDVRDEHGRFIGRESLPYRAGFIDRPIVDEYASLLRKWLWEVGISVREPRREFSVLFTHDVDIPTRHIPGIKPLLKSVAKAMLGRTSWRHAAEATMVALGLRKDPLDTFDQMISLDARLDGLAAAPARQSAYFFLACGADAGEKAYDITRRYIRQTIRKVLKSGAMVGLHASYSAGKDPIKLANEVAALENACGREIHRNRHHFLAWREIQDGWDLARAGIRWDSTLGYADVPGFRLGVCRPIPLFDPISKKRFGIEEHPLIVMDCQLDWDKYLGLDEEEAFERCKHLIGQTKMHEGQFVMLWHNTMFESKTGSYHPRLYRRVIEYLSSLAET